MALWANFVTSSQRLVTPLGTSTNLVDRRVCRNCGFRPVPRRIWLQPALGPHDGFVPFASGCGCGLGLGGLGVDDNPGSY